jgi:hypothetical protein
MSDEKGEETTEFDDLVEAVGELTFRLGFEALDDDAEDFENALDKWLASPPGKKLLKLCDRAEKNDFEERKLEAILAEACKEFAGRGPHRPTTALCVVVLAHAIDRVTHYGHLHQVKRALMRCIYSAPRADAVGDGALGGSEDMEEDVQGLESLHGFENLLHATPHFEIARVLRPKAKALVRQRELMEEAKAHADERKARRKQAIIRTTMRWQNNLRHHFFQQWHNTINTLKAQRKSLLSHFQKAHEKTVGMIFKAWRTWLVSTRLERFMNERENLQMNLENLKHSCIDAKDTNKTMNENLVEQIKRRDDAEQKLKETLEAIHQQRHPETMALVKSLATSLLDSVDLILNEMDKILKWCAASPSVMKLAKVFWIDREELKAKQAEIEQQEKEKEKKEQNDLLKAQKQAKADRRRVKQQNVAENKCQQAEAEVKERVETEWKEKLAARQEAGEAIGELTMENMHIAMDEAAKKVRMEIMDDAKKAWAKEDYLAEEKEQEARVRLFEQQKEMEKKFKDKMARKDNKMKESDIDEALEKVPEYPQDRLLLRWIKYTLRRSTRHGYPYRRKCLNFGNDLRDGVTYTVMMRQLAPEVWPGDALDSEIDPQARIDAVMDMAAQIKPRAVGFITRGHIMGFDQFLNAAFLTRLFLTRPHNLGEIFVKKARKQLKVVREKWGDARQTAMDLCDFKTWKAIRMKHDDEGLDSVLSFLQVVSADVSNVQEQVNELMERATQGRKAWAMLYRRMDGFLTTLYGAKVLQEDHAEHGNLPNTDNGECPIMLSDYRHEIKFLRYTVTKRERIRKLMDAVNQTNLVRKEKRTAANETPPRELTPEEVAAIKAPLMPTEDAEQEVADIEKILRDHYVDLKKIFEYYAAGGEGGAPTDISDAEWHRFCDDCKFAHKTDIVEKDDFSKIFDATDDGIEPEAMVWSDSESDYSEDSDADVQAEEDVPAPEEGKEEGEDGDGDDGEEKEGEEEEEEYSWTLDEDEREIQPTEWVEGIVHMAFRRYPTVQPMSKRIKRLVTEFIVPNACKSNTDNFRGELSMDEVQAVFKKYKPQLMTMFLHYAVEHPAAPGQPPMEPSMDGPIWLGMMKDCKLVTRKSDVPNDMPELAAREIFMNVQMEEEEEGSADTGGGADEMIYLEYLEAWGAVTCYKKVNPYIPLHVRMEELFVQRVFQEQKRFALSRKNMKKKKK